MYDHQIGKGHHTYTRTYMYMYMYMHVYVQGALILLFHMGAQQPNSFPINISI